MCLKLEKREKQNKKKWKQEIRTPFEADAIEMQDESSQANVNDWLVFDTWATSQCSTGPNVHAPCGKVRRLDRDHFGTTDTRIAKTEDVGSTVET